LENEWKLPREIRIKTTKKDIAEQKCSAKSIENHVKQALREDFPE